MGRKLYVGNLPYSATEQSVRDAFSKCGTVASVSIISDRDTGQSKGFGFVEMSSDAEAQAAIQQLNGTSLEGRQIKVNEAKPKAPVVVAAAAVAAAATAAVAAGATAGERSASRSTLSSRETPQRCGVFFGGQEMQEQFVAPNFVNCDYGRN